MQNCPKLLEGNSLFWWEEGGGREGTFSVKFLALDWFQTLEEHSLLTTTKATLLISTSNCVIKIKIQTKYVCERERNVTKFLFCCCLFQQKLSFITPVFITLNVKIIHWIKLKLKINVKSVCTASMQTIEDTVFALFLYCHIDVSPRNKFWISFLFIWWNMEALTKLESFWVTVTDLLLIKLSNLSRMPKNWQMPFQRITGEKKSEGLAWTDGSCFIESFDLFLSLCV